MFHKILVALDDSEAGEQVFQQALSLAKASNSGLLLLHVITPKDTSYPDPTIYSGVSTYYAPLYQELLKRWQERLAEYEKHQLERLRSLAAAGEVAQVKTEFTQNMGDPGRTICAIARNWGADLIIVGRRGRSRVRELVLGSISNYVMHHAPCSVLIAQHSVAEVEPSQKQHSLVVAK
jgi:nucleotide-binding universal stress UspA family protein